MMADLGRAALMVALVTSAFGGLAAVQGARTRRPDWLQAAEKAAPALAVLLSVASAALLYALLTRDFQVSYVAENTNRSLPIFYTISAFWAGQAGSLLFWAWFLGLFTAITVWQNRDRNRALMPHVLAILFGIALFFVVLLLFVSSPFTLLPERPPDGRGLNPLLQNPGMFFHPPTLYLGFVGFSIPYAFAMAALFTRSLGPEWIQATRKWTVFSWFFLTMGNLFGANWAYQVLGWGGFWMWDPIENASFLPWLTSTAYLHSVMIQERRNMLKVWNMVLVILTFSLTIFGTFLTRSGVVVSVHSFAQSNIGPFFVSFLALAVVGSMVLLFRRLDTLRSENALDGVVSRESSFLFNNLLLVGATFATFWGTVFPMVSEAFKGVKVSMGPPFYNQVNIPIGLALLLLMGLCPLLAWRRSSLKNLSRNLTYPVILGTLTGAGIYAAGIREPYSLTAFAFSMFVLASIGQEAVRGIRARHRRAGEGMGLAALNLVRRNRRRYGGYIIHAGIVLMYVGIAGTSAYQVEKLVTLQPGEKAQIGKYTLRFDGLTQAQRPGTWDFRAVLTVFEGERLLGPLHAVKRVHDGSEQPHTIPGIRSTPKEDLYVLFNGVDEKEKKAAGFKLLINPLVTWLWWGGWVLGLGTLVAIWPDKKRPPRRRRPSADRAEEPAYAEA